MRTPIRVALLAATVVCALPSIAAAQSGQTAQIPLQFDFLNPGARSLGLGSAFIAVADDATSAFTNPAGLTLIPRPEVSFEGRYRSLDTSYLAGGRLNGTPTGTGVDTVSGPIYRTSGDSAFRPYFLSFVFPWKRFAVSGYRQELVLQNNAFVTDGAIFQGLFSGTPTDFRQAGIAGERRISIVNYGGAIGYRVNERISAGVGISAYRQDLSADFASLAVADIYSPTIPGSRGQGSTTTQAGESTRMGFNAGVLLTLTPKVRAGVTFRQGTSFDFTQASTVPGRPNSSAIARFQTPMVVGAGVRIQPSSQWSFAIDYDRVQYSRLTTDFINLQVPEAAVPRISIPDGNEIHVGAEYTLLNLPKTPSIRVGTWYDPKHAVEYTSDGSNSSDDLILQAVFPGGRSLWHYSAGIGVPISPKLEFNAGADFTSERRYFSASFVARFGQ